jgi:hypothetical protein
VIGKSTVPEFHRKVPDDERTGRNGQEYIQEQHTERMDK